MKRHLDVVAVVAVGVVDDVAAGFPERLAGANDARRLAFQLEQHLAFEHVAEGRPARMPVRRGARTARRVVDDDGHGVCAFRDERRLHFLHDRQRVFPCGVIVLRHRSFPLSIVISDGGAAAVGVQCRAGDETRAGRGQEEHRLAISSGLAVRPNGSARPSSSLVSPHSASTPSVLVGPGATLLTRTRRDAELGGPGAGQGFHGGLGSAVRARTGDALRRDHRGDVDDAAVSSLEHSRHQAGGQEVGAADVGVERLLERRRASWSTVSAAGKLAALLTRMSTSPPAATSDFTDSMSDRSAWMKRTLPSIPAAAALPRSASRPVMMTEAPSRASSRAHARPMPAVPPVINAVLYANSIESSRYAMRCSAAAKSPRPWATWANAMRSRCRPRDTRDMTVPMRDVQDRGGFRVGVSLRRRRSTPRPRSPPAARPALP